VKDDFSMEGLNLHVGMKVFFFESVIRIGWKMKNLLMMSDG
jgi:hypothetical protein